MFAERGYSGVQIGSDTDIRMNSEEENLEQEAPVESVEEAVAPAIDKLELLRAESKENYDKFLRTAAELENVKKRVAKERSDLLKYAGESLARDLLDVSDNLERALLAAATSPGEEFVSGVKMIVEQLYQVFERHGIRGESALGSAFDPAKQEALASVPTLEKEPNSVIDEYRKTYFFKDKLLRPGQVVVAVRPPEDS